jgi:endoglucanase
MRRRALLKSAAGYFGAAVFSPAFQSLDLLAFPVPGQTKPGNSIRVGQIGLLPGRPKIASITSRASTFVVHPAGGDAVAFSGTLSNSRNDPASGDIIQLADFSALSKPGTYFIALDTGERSNPFSIAPGIYAEPLRLAMRAFYGQRCGCAVNLGDGYAHPRCHLNGAFHRSSGRSGPFGNHGGWHDAGDYGRYVVNSGITTGTLLWAWEMYGHDLAHLQLRIPESGGRTPDVLAEIRWNLNWMLSLQDADGGVWHTQTSEQFCGFVMPQNDSTVSYVIGTGVAPYKSTCATADLAAVAAIAARCYAPYDAAFALQCLAAARKAWEWCHANPAVLFANPEGVATGGYEDNDCGDEMLWATAELYRTTGELHYQQAFSEALLPGFAHFDIEAPNWGTVSSLACWTYVLSRRNSSDKLSDAIRDSTLKTAENLVIRTTQNGYGNTLALDDYVWGSNSLAANHSMLLLVAFHFSPHQEFLNTALANLHYLFGRNCFGVSWMTHVGTRPFMHPHHRPSAADHIDAPWPGLLSGGPNAHPGDPIARQLPQQPPMRMWVDDQGAYSMNEIAINWNAPLVFALAGARSLAS